MDTQEAANLAQIENTRLSRKLVSIGYATLAVCALGTIFAAWAILRSPDASQPPPTGGGFMLIKWLPVIILGSCSLTLAVALFVISFRRLKYSKRESDYKLAMIQVNRLKQELGASNSSNLTLRGDLESQTKLLESKTQSLEISRREVAEVRAEADAQTRTYDTTFSGMKQEMEALKQQAETQRNRADSEAHDKSLIRELKNRAEAELADLAFLKELANQQAKDLSTYVKVQILTQPHCGHLQLTGRHLCVLLYVTIKNESVFEIAIEEKQITGQFRLDRVAFREQVGQLVDDFRPPLHDLKPRQTETITIEQLLLASEAEKIDRCLSGDPEAKLSIAALNVPISINNAGFRATNAPRLHLSVSEVPLKYFKRNTDNP